MTTKKTKKKKSPSSTSKSYYERPRTRKKELKYVFSPPTVERTPTSSSKRKKRLRSEDTGNTIKFVDTDENSIEFRVDSNGLIDEYCDGVLVSKNLAVLRINLYLLTIEDDEEMIHLKQNDSVRVFTWFKTIDTICQIKFTCLNEHDVAQRIPPEHTSLIEEKLGYKIVECLKCAHIRSSPILCKAPYCINCTPPHGHYLWLDLPLQFKDQNLYSPMSMRSRTPEGGGKYDSYPLLEERSKTSAPVRIIVPGHPVWKKKVESLKYEISSMSETEIVKELKESSSSVGMADTKASKMIALLSHRKATMDLRYEKPECFVSP